jgi:hypothetical protein
VIRPHPTSPIPSAMQARQLPCTDRRAGFRPTLPEHRHGTARSPGRAATLRRGRCRGLASRRSPGIRSRGATAKGPDAGPMDTSQGLLPVARRLRGPGGASRPWARRLAPVAPPPGFAQTTPAVLPRNDL